MSNRITFTVVSLLAMLLLTLHLTDDFAHHGGTTPLGFLASTLIVVTWLYGVLALSGRRWGFIISILGSLLALFVPAWHLMQAGVVDSTIAGKSDPYFFVWTLLALAITSLYSLVLALQGVIGRL